MLSGNSFNNQTGNENSSDEEDNGLIEETYQDSSHEEDNNELNQETHSENVIFNGREWVSELQPAVHVEHMLGLSFTAGRGWIEELPADKRVYIFDFDKTITREHTYYQEIIRKTLDTENVLKNVRQCDLFRQFVVDAINSGHRVAIATFNDEKLNKVKKKGGVYLIKHYLLEVFKDPKIVEAIEIVAFNPDNPHRIDPNGDKNKQKHISYILQIFNAKNNQYVFVDDDPENINAQIKVSEIARVPHQCWLINDANEVNLWKRLQASLKTPEVLKNPLSLYEKNYETFGKGLEAVKTFVSLSKFIPHWELIPIRHKLQTLVYIITLNAQLTEPTEWGIVQQSVVEYFLKDQDLIHSICFNETIAKEFFELFFEMLKEMLKNNYRNFNSNIGALGLKFIEQLENFSNLKHYLPLQELYDKLDKLQRNLSKQNSIYIPKTFPKELKLALFKRLYPQDKVFKDNSEIMVFNNILNAELTDAQNPYSTNNIFFEIVDSNPIKRLLTSKFYLFQVPNLKDTPATRKVFQLYQTYFDFTKVNFEAKRWDEYYRLNVSWYLTLMVFLGEIKCFTEGFDKVVEGLNKSEAQLINPFIEKLLESISACVPKASNKVRAWDEVIKRFPDFEQKVRGKRAIYILSSKDKELLSTLEKLPPEQLDSFFASNPFSPLSFAFQIERGSDAFFTKAIFDRLLDLNMSSELFSRFLKRMKKANPMAGFKPEGLLELAVLKKNHGMLVAVLKDNPKLIVTDKLIEQAQHDNFPALMALTEHKAASEKPVPETLWQLLSQTSQHTSREALRLNFLASIFKGGFRDFAQKNTYGQTITTVLINKFFEENASGSNVYLSLALLLHTLGAPLSTNDLRRVANRELVEQHGLLESELRHIKHCSLSALQKAWLSAVYSNDLASVAQLVADQAATQALLEDSDLIIQLFTRALLKKSWLICQHVLKADINKVITKTENNITFAIEMIKTLLASSQEDYLASFLGFEMLLKGGLSDCFKRIEVKNYLLTELRNKINSPHAKREVYGSILLALKQYDISFAEELTKYDTNPLKDLISLVGLQVLVVDKVMLYGGTYSVNNTEKNDGLKERCLNLSSQLFQPSPLNQTESLSSSAEKSEQSSDLHNSNNLGAQNFPPEPSITGNNQPPNSSSPNSSTQVSQVSVFQPAPSSMASASYSSPSPYIPRPTGLSTHSLLSQPANPHKRRGSDNDDGQEEKTIKMNRTNQ